jgi:tetratricopeptide (TPR) repeat protein
LEATGDTTGALALYQQSLQILIDHELFTRQAMVLGNIALLLTRTGEYEQALKHLHDSIHICQQTGNAKVEGSCADQIGVIYRLLGRFDESLESYERALCLFQQMGARRDQACTLSNIALVQENIGQHQKAMDFYEQSMQIYQAIEDKRFAGVTLGNMALVLMELNENARALDYFQQAIRTLREIGAQREQGIMLGNLGDLYSKTQKLDQARPCLEQAIDISAKSDPLAHGVFLGSLAVITAHSNREEALALLEQGEALLKESPLEYGKFLCKKSRVLLASGKHDSSQDCLEQAQQIAEALQLHPDSALYRMLAQAGWINKSKRSEAWLPIL